MAFKTHLGVIRRSSAAAIEENVILDLQSTDVFLQARETVLDSGFVILICGLVLVASFLRESGQFVVTKSQVRSLQSGGASGVAANIFSVGVGFGGCQ